ncbi:MAG: M20/M25/M40 family metallo-hydrolase [Cyclobacteriaceae bacterium]|nr:M20/M25/M40 family metallo-hydrolase [Cyclobacteriaceae bacterium]MDW8330651.1 M20/M25/M40 family metallo-hydrolase [Cyclobacteriaceae bacterium]
MQKPVLLITLTVLSLLSAAQTEDEKFIRKIFDEALTSGKAFEVLEYMCTNIGPRLSGSPGAAAAVEYTRQVMQHYGFDSVWLQPIMVPHWVRGKPETGRIVNSKKLGMQPVNVCALGGSVGTGPAGVLAGVVEVRSWDELKKLGEQGRVKGKIVFFNRPMDPRVLQTFSAYGTAVDQRANGASEAAKFGAVAALVRSMSPNPEDYPHTGSLRYALNVPKIPAAAIATNHADLLSRLLADDPNLQFYLEMHCETLPDAPSFNVVGELRGSENPKNYIVVGGHLDSWDLGQGAHDDGAGCVQSIEALRILRSLGYKPRHTLRAVMFMNEENGLRGGLEYARAAAERKEVHIAAIESDRGGFVPRGFTVPTTAAAKAKVQSWKPLLEPYGVHDFSTEGGGADISPLAPQGVPLLGLLPDSQRYFSYHHTPEDTIDKVDRRELALGAAAMAAMVYLIDRYGLK